MAFDLNWGMLNQTPDIGQTFAKGVEQGQATALANRKRSVLAALGANPRDTAAQNALLAIDPQAAMQVQKGLREQDDFARAETARGLIGQYVAQETGGVLGSPSMGGAPGGGMSALADPAMAPTLGTGDQVVVQARPPQTRVSIGDIARLDPDMASKVTDHVAQLDKNGRDAFKARSETMGAAAQYLRSYPQANRAALIDALAPQLEQAGISRQELEGADLSDAGLDGYVNLAIGAKDALDNVRQDRSTNATIANQNARLGLARNADARGARSDARAARSEGRAAVRFKERNLDRAAVAAGGVVRSDLSDLEY